MYSSQIWLILSSCTTKWSALLIFPNLLAASNNLPTNSVFVSAYKYNAKTNHNTDDEPLSVNDDIIVYYDTGSVSSNSSFKISNSTIITHLRNKKLDELGI